MIIARFRSSGLHLTSRITVTAPRYCHVGCGLNRPFDYRINRVGGADVVARGQIALGRCRHGQMIKRDNLAPSQPIGETSTHWVGLMHVRNG